MKKKERSKSSGEPFVPWADRGASVPTSAERPSCTHDAKLFPDARAQESARRCERTDRSTNAADRGARAESGASYARAGFAKVKQEHSTDSRGQTGRTTKRRRRGGSGGDETQVAQRPAGAHRAGGRLSGSPGSAFSTRRSAEVPSNGEDLVLRVHVAVPSVGPSASEREGEDPRFCRGRCTHVCT